MNAFLNWWLSLWHLNISISPDVFCTEHSYSVLVLSLYHGLSSSRKAGFCRSYLYRQTFASHENFFSAILRRLALWTFETTVEAYANSFWQFFWTKHIFSFHLVHAFRVPAHLSRHGLFYVFCICYMFTILIFFDFKNTWRNASCLSRYSDLTGTFSDLNV